MRLVKVVNYDKPYISKKDGKEHPSVNYYLEFCTASDSTGIAKTTRIAICPKFDNSLRDWYALDIASDVQTIGTKKDN